ncbi:MAG: murein biosynthesis integral membrane protein MurJ [Gammaproteobacteria bacterium RBG_16_51_14]|nr:MAG: murein biosynthesis integral membrane protein MurJ [Gammaproteobacteria bacterium RBG_16_51_14]
MTMISRVFGLIRDVVIARLFGAGLGMDVFIVAFRIPNFLRRLFAEGGFSQAFVPVLSEYREQRSQQEVKALIDHTAATLGLVLFAITVIGILAAPLLIMVFAPGFVADEGKHALASDMLRITFPYILFISLTAFAGGILNTYKQFVVPALTPVLLNLSLIAAGLWLAPLMDEPVKALAWGVLIAGIMQLLFQFPFLFRIRMLPQPCLDRDREGVKRILKLMLPALFAVSIVQINLLVDTLIASFLITGSISWLYYSDRLLEFPIGVFGVAIGTVVLPSLSEKHAQQSAASFSRTLDWALRWILLIGIPAALGLILLAKPLLTTLFQYEEFTAHDVTMASRSLIAFACGLPAFLLIKVLAPGFFSRQDTKTPVKVGAIALVSNIVLNLLLVVPLAHAGLALATSLAAFIQVGLLYGLLRRQKVYHPEAGWCGFITKITIASLLMCLLLDYAVADFAQWLAWGVADRVVQLALWILAGTACYFIALWAMRMPWRDMTAQI